MYARVSLKGGGRMKHQKEWHTCDRCGVEIKKGILCGNSVTRNGILNTTYDLCTKCMEDFERFMRNEEH
jgi:dUTPase